MYCPQCGEQQNSGNLRFCNRCGLPLELVSEVVTNGGTLPQLQDLYNKHSTIFTRKNGIFFTIFWFILFVPFGAAFWGVLDVEELSGVSAVFGVFSSLLILLFTLFFLGNPKEIPQNQIIAQNLQQLPNQKNNQNALPEQQQQPAQNYVSPQQVAQPGMWKAPDTGELVTPGSVTEGTTKLLSQAEQEQEKTKYFNNNN